MGIEAKSNFTRRLESILGHVVTADQVGVIMAEVSDALQYYELDEIAPDTSAADDLLSAYISALTVEGRAQKTIDRYVYVIRRLMDHAKVPTRQVSVYHIRAYLAAEKARGIADSTLEGYREIYSAYFNWLQRESLIDKNPAANLSTIKCAKKEKKTYSDTDFEKLNQACSSARDRAIIHFLDATGCRISEMTGLDRGSVNLTAMECTVHGKGDKERTVYLDQVAAMYLREYLADRTDDCPALFVNRRGERLQPGGVRHMLCMLAKASGVEHVHPHRFRRTLATDLARHGMPVQEIAIILGHDKIETTMQYVNLDKDDIKQSYRRFYA